MKFPSSRLVVELVLLLTVLVESGAFTPIPSTVIDIHQTSRPLSYYSSSSSNRSCNCNHPTCTPLIGLRGGDLSTSINSGTTTTSTALSCHPMMKAAVSSLASTLTTSSPLGILSLSAIASAVLIPLTMIRQGYVFSVGYGYSVFAMALFIAQSFGISLNLLTPSGGIGGVTTNVASLLCAAVAFYGVRLGTHLVVREWTVPAKRKQMKEFDKTPRLKRIPFAISVSFFYAFLTSPLLYVARAYTTATTTTNLIPVTSVTKVGVGLTWAGALLEALADTHKFIVKRNAPDDTFVGPTGGIYKLCRHPNYFAEVLFWFGLSVSGVPFFGRQYGAYMYSVLGLFGIYYIMTNATKRLDATQFYKYGGQDKYDEYVKKVKASLWPGIS